MRFGLEEHIILQLTTLFEQQPKIDKAIVFGSRAKGNYKPGSDIDIAFKGTDLNTKDLLNLYVKWDDLEIPFKLDLLRYETTKEPELKDHIDRVGIDLYSRWKTVKLQEIVSKLGDGLHGTPEYDVYGKYYFINGNNLIDGKIIIKDNTQRVSEKEYLKYKKDLNDRTILLGINGTIGNVALYNGEKCILGKSACYFNVIDNVSKDFIKYVIMDKTFQTYIENFANGSTIMNVSLKTVREYEFALPPMQEQNAIANILTSLDDKIDLLYRQNKILEQLAETLFRQWFVEEAEESWEEKKLGDLLTITSSKRIFYSEYVSFGIPFYRSKEIIELRKSGSTNSELYISKERFDEINNKFGSPKEGDILMTSVGTLGVAYRIRKSDKFYFKDGNLTWFKDFKGLPSSIIYLWLISQIGQEKLAAITIGSTQEALTIEGLKSISFKIPPREKVKDYEIEFNSIIKKMEFNQTQIRTLAQTRDNLLPKLMSGEVRVNL